MAPEEARRKWAKIKEDKRRRKEERIRVRFVRRPPPMTVMTPEDIHGNGNQGATESHQRGKTMGEVNLQPEKLLERKQEAEILAWWEDKQKIKVKYAVGEWSGEQIIERFIDMVKWCAKRPAGGVVDPADIPWPILRRPQLIIPKDVNAAQVEFFLVMLQSFKGGNFLVHLKDMRIRFHPDKWQRSWKKIEDEIERGKWENAMLTVSQVISAQYDFYVKSK